VSDPLPRLEPRIKTRKGWPSVIESALECPPQLWCPRPENDLAHQLSSLWREGLRPNVEDFLAQAGVCDPDRILKLVWIDQLERVRLDQRIPAETYLDMFPVLRADPDRAIDLIFAEFMLREEADQEPTLEEYIRRFPEYAAELKPQIELHQAIETHCEALDSWDRYPGVSSDRAAGDSAMEAERYPEIPGYEILGVLGRGAMGVVYRAFQMELRRSVAIKMVHPRVLARPSILARFRVEAEAIGRLQHPNIVQIHEVGQAAGSPFLVLELVDGRKLAECIAGQPQPLRHSAELVETLARAIHDAHRQGVVHRDLSPSNIMLTTCGIPKITDFGLAKLVIGGGEQTQSGEMLGTPGYMAPEQAKCRQDAVGAAADVYALGAILYELLTGAPPFKSESGLETLRRLVSEEPLAPSRARPAIPRNLEAICLQCLRKEPAERYKSAGALADDLHRFLEGVPVLARRSSTLEHLVRWCRRNPCLAGANLTIAALAVILVVGLSVAKGIILDQRRQISHHMTLARIADTRSRWVLRQQPAAPDGNQRQSSRSRLAGPGSYVANVDDRGRDFDRLASPESGVSGSVIAGAYQGHARGRQPAPSVGVPQRAFDAASRPGRRPKLAAAP
jgi:serine/threonine-protein kinase